MATMDLSDKPPGEDEGVYLDPVVIVLEMDHVFKKKVKTKHVCAICGLNRLHPDHGAFSWQSSGRSIDNWRVRMETNDMWQEAYIAQLNATGLPKPCKSIEVSARIWFHEVARGGGSRDEDNYRYPLSKFLGDALQRGGWLLDDGWSYFRFRELDYEGVIPGVQRTEFMLTARV